MQGGKYRLTRPPYLPVFLFWPFVLAFPIRGARVKAAERSGAPEGLGLEAGGATLHPGEQRARPSAPGPLPRPLFLK